MNTYTVQVEISLVVETSVRAGSMEDALAQAQKLAERDPVGTFVIVRKGVGYCYHNDSSVAAVMK